MMKTQIDLETARTEIEKSMMFLPSDVTEKERRMYLAGYIDGLQTCSHISMENRDILYAEYAF